MGYRSNKRASTLRFLPILESFSCQRIKRNQEGNRLSGGIAKGQQSFLKIELGEHKRIKDSL